MAGHFPAGWTRTTVEATFATSSSINGSGALPVFTLRAPRPGASMLGRGSLVGPAFRAGRFPVCPVPPLGHAPLSPHGTVQVSMCLQLTAQTSPPSAGSPRPSPGFTSVEEVLLRSGL